MKERRRLRMTPDVSGGQPPGVQRNGSALNLGDTVTLTISGSKVSCLVVGMDRGKLTLVPLMNILPQNRSLEGDVLQIETAIGLADFVVQAQGAIPAVVGALQVAAPQSREPRVRERQYYRVNADFPIQISPAGDGWHRGRSENISEGGLLAVSPWAVNAEIGQIIYVRIFLPDSPVILVRGVILRKSDCEPGCEQIGAQFVAEFTDISPEDRQRLVQYIYKLQLKELAEVSNKMQ